MLPQTWENPDVKLEGSDIGGDNDPLDVVELSEDVLPLGAVVPVRVVGALGLIDEGELDWKLIAISNDHPAASKINGMFAFFFFVFRFLKQNMMIMFSIHRYQRC